MSEEPILVCFWTFACICPSYSKNALIKNNIECMFKKVHLLLIGEEHSKDWLGH